MPIHNWSRISDGMFHWFHQTWIVAIATWLNEGRLPEGFYAIGKVYANEVEPEVLAVEARPPVDGRAKRIKRCSDSARVSQRVSGSPIPSSDADVTSWPVARSQASTLRGTFSSVRIRIDGGPNYASSVRTSAAKSIAARKCSGLRCGYSASNSSCVVPAPRAFSTSSTVSRVPLNTGLPSMTSLRSSM